MATRRENSSQDHQQPRNSDGKFKSDKASSKHQSANRDSDHGSTSDRGGLTMDRRSSSNR